MPFKPVPRGLIHSPLRTLLRPVMRSPFVRGYGGFSPSQVFAGGAAGVWLDPSDISTGFQDSAGTTPQTASGQPTGKRLDKSGRANHVLQATAGARPEYDLISGIASDFTDGSNDGYSTAVFAAGTLVAAMDLFITIKRAAAGPMVPVSDTPGGVKGIVLDSTSAALCVIGLGSAETIFVNNVQVGGVHTATRQQVEAAVSFGSYKVLELHDLDMSTWTQFTLGLFAGLMLNADTAQLVLCPSQPTAIRNKLRTYCGAKAGLSL
jgi:hypothetical protein